MPSLPFSSLAEVESASPDPPSSNGVGPKGSPLSNDRQGDAGLLNRVRGVLGVRLSEELAYPP